MSLDGDILSPSRTKTRAISTDEQARRAVKVFRSLQPTLTAYARVLTKRNDVRVTMSSSDNGSTTGKEIFFRPPLALGESVRHDRALCDKRNADKQLLCPACARREQVLAVIYHEIAHIAFDSFAETTEADRLELTKKTLDETKGPFADAIRRRIETAPYYERSSYISLANLVSKFLPTLVNALEDARVNREMFKARPGTKVMFEAMANRTFAEGVEQVDLTTGETVVKHWRDYPLNKQAVVGVFCKASGYDYSDWFRPSVVEALDDPELGRLVRRLDTVRTTRGVYNLAFPVLARLRELGFCRLPEDPEVPEEKEEGPTEESESDPPPAEAEEPDESDSPGSDDSDGSDDSGEDAGNSDDEGEPDAGDDGDAGDGDPSTDGELGEGDGEAEEAEDADASSYGGSSPGEAEDDSSEPDRGELGTGSELPGGEGADPGGDASDDDSDDSPGSRTTSSFDGGVEADAEETEDEDGDLADSPPVRSGAESEEESDEADGDLEMRREGMAGARAESDIERSSPGDGDGEADGVLEQPDDGCGDQNSPGAGRSDDASLPDCEEGEGDLEAVESDEMVTEGDDGSTGDGSSGSEVDGEGEPIDSGADLGEGGIRLEDEGLEFGDPEDVEDALHGVAHPEDRNLTAKEARQLKTGEKAIDKAVVQSMYFETPSSKMHGVREHFYGDTQASEYGNAWNRTSYEDWGYSKAEIGIEKEINIPESILGPALLRMRVAFAANQRSKMQRHLKAGRVNSRVLGKRAYLDDERLFQRKRVPGKRSYAVVIGMDLSGSTIGVNLLLEKRAVYAQAELLSRMGIDFVIVGHSGNVHDSVDYGLDLDVYHVKQLHDPWNDAAKLRLNELGPDAANLDGHALEYLRKQADKCDATDKIILYYSDGKMPAENHDEELEILQREIRTCHQKNYTLLGVGIRTDSPARHGLDTVQVDDDSDVVRVVKHLEKRLLA